MKTTKKAQSAELAKKAKAILETDTPGDALATAASAILDDIQAKKVSGRKSTAHASSKKKIVGLLRGGEIANQKFFVG